MKRRSAFRLEATVLLGCLVCTMTPRAMAQAPPRAPAGPAQGRGPGIVSPEVLPDHRVTFRIQAPKASQVTLRGDWMEGIAAETLSKGDDGVVAVFARLAQPPDPLGVQVLRLQRIVPFGRWLTGRR